MTEAILSLDRDLFLFLNNLGSEPYDGFWKFLTRQINWLPFFLLLAWMVYKSLGWKKMLLSLVVLGLMMLFTDQMTNLVKNTVQRLRPCSEPSLEGLMREVKSSSSFSFFSGHACNSTAAATFLIFLLKPYRRYMGLLLFWPLIFAYTRIYLGVHYPGDILTGFAVGSICGYAFYRLYDWILNTYFSTLKDAAHGQSVSDRE